MTRPVFDADGNVLEVGDTVEFQMQDECGETYHGIGDVIEISGDEVFITEPGNMGAEGWTTGDCVRLRV